MRRQQVLLAEKGTRSFQSAAVLADVLESMTTVQAEEADREGCSTIPAFLQSRGIRGGLRDRVGARPSAYFV